MTSAVRTSEKVKEASYKLAELIVKKQEVLERTNLPTFLTLFKSKLSFGKSQFYYTFIFHSFTAKVK
jgi:hypothetical protein